MQKDLGLTYVFIAHDLSVVKHISDRIVVMYLGNVVELTDSQRIYEHPAHPYTQALISAIPVPDPEARANKQVLTGDVPNPRNPPSGCPFHTRCPYAKEKGRMEKCITEKPKLANV